MRVEKDLRILLRSKREKRTSNMMVEVTQETKVGNAYSLISTKR